MNPERSIPDLPPWLRALIDATGDDFAWHAPAWGAAGDGKTEHLFDDLPLSRATVREANALLARGVSLGVGATMQRSSIEYSAGLWFDPEAPQHVLLSLCSEHPPFLWIPAGGDRASLLKAMGRYFPKGDADAKEAEKTCRLLLGLRAGGLPSLEEIERHLLMQPFIDPGSLRPGSVHAEDAPGFAAVSNVLTSHTRSRLSIEDHGQGASVEIIYTPSSDGAVVQHANARFGSDFPLDVPIDVVGALLGFACNSATQWLGPPPWEAKEASELARDLIVLYWLDYPELPALLRRYSVHESEVVRGVVADLVEASAT